MNILSLLYPVSILGGMGMLFGAGLIIAAKIFNVPVDERIELILKALPGANCGGCGYAGCEAFAKSVVAGHANPGGCPVGGNECLIKIGEILGIRVATLERRRAYIHCAGCLGKSVLRYDYFGVDDCKAAAILAGGGSRKCVYGCLGGGSCVIACPFNAITLSDGLAVVDAEKCTACGVCVASCPKKLIFMVPYASRTNVACLSLDAGKDVRANCSAGCIACGICERICETGAIKVINNIAAVDYGKCVNCGKCAEKCPAKCIVG